MSRSPRRWTSRCCPPSRAARAAHWRSRNRRSRRCLPSLPPRSRCWRAGPPFVFAAVPVAFASPPVRHRRHFRRTIGARAAAHTALSTEGIGVRFRRAGHDGRRRGRSSRSAIAAIPAVGAVANFRPIAALAAISAGRRGFIEGRGNRVPLPASAVTDSPSPPGMPGSPGLTPSAPAMPSSP